MAHHKSLLTLLLLTCLSSPTQAQPLDVARMDQPRILRTANAALVEAPVTITAFPSPRSSGGPHDFYSEGDYWWPNPADPGGPYIQRDGLTNPDNFVAHRRALVRLSVQVPALVAAWKTTGEGRYARHAVAHLRAWFVDRDTEPVRISVWNGVMK